MAVFIILLIIAAFIFYKCYYKKAHARKKFIEFVKALDNGEEWAQEKFQALWHTNDPTLIPRIHQARVEIYRYDAINGDENAIIKYAGGLAWSDQEAESIKWYMKLIDKGNTEAMKSLALNYTEHGAFGENETEYKKYMLKAAEKGDAKAQYMIALEYASNGDNTSARKWYKESADQNYPDGVRGYARILDTDMAVMNAAYYQKKNYAKDYYEECSKYYKISSAEDLYTCIVELYDKVEDLYNECLDYVEETHELQDILISFGQLYSNAYASIPARPYRAAYYYYNCYRDCEYDLANKFLHDIIKKENLKLTDDDFKEWENTSFDEWAEAHGIDE